METQQRTEGCSLALQIRRTASFFARFCGRLPLLQDYPLTHILGVGYLEQRHAAMNAMNVDDQTRDSDE